MRSNYKKLGDYIRVVDERNKDRSIKNLQGVSISKVFIPSIANMIGVDTVSYKVVRRGQFAYGPVTSRNGDKCSIARLYGEDCIISSSYTVFEDYNTEKLDPEYLMMWYLRPEFDRYARFMSNGSAREVFDWNSMCEMEIPIPDISVQRRIVHDYKVVTDRIKLLEKINRNLLEQAKMLFQAWFIDYEHFGGECPSDWKEGILEDVVDFYNGYAFKSKELLDAPDPENECFHVFKQGHINRGGGFNISGTKSWFPKKNAEKLERYVLKKGDILMAMTDMKNNVAILGNTAIMEMDNTYILNQRVALLRPTGKFGIEYPFVSLLTNSTDFVSDLRSRAHSGVQVNLSATEIKNSKLLIPSEKVNYEFNTIVKPMFEAMIEHDMENMRLIELRNTLLPKLVSGELDVSGLDI